MRRETLVWFDGLSAVAVAAAPVLAPLAAARVAGGGFGDEGRLSDGERRDDHAAIGEVSRELRALTLGEVGAGDELPGDHLSCRACRRRPTVAIRLHEAA